MKRERKKPKVGFLEESRYELANADELLLKRTFDMGVIHGRKEMIVHACEWAKMQNFSTSVQLDLKKFLEDFIKEPTND